LLTKTLCILFDLGGVIVNWHDSWLIDEVSKRFNLSRPHLEQEFMKNLKMLSSGKMTESKFWSTIGNKLQSSEVERQNFLLEPIFRKFVSVNDSIVKLSRELKEAGFHIGILSNTEPVTFSIIEELTSLNHFDFKFLSYKIGHVKPSPMIYQHVIENVPFKKYLTRTMMLFKPQYSIFIKALRHYSFPTITDRTM